jgi:diadenosine tetraphosphatase ApaH/serine/threonine PP2A family protein phosphatase
MKLALLTDIHANIQGMEACLEHARVRGATRYALLGDFVGYGANPGEVVELARLLAGQGALLIKGNHDELAVAPPHTPRTLGDSTAAWTHAQLSAAQRQFLDQLPMTAQLGSVLLVHASAEEPGRWQYVYDEDAAHRCLDAAIGREGVQHVFVGHVHHQTVYCRDGDAPAVPHELRAGATLTMSPDKFWIATVGSAGQPRDGSPRAMYALFDTDTFEFIFHRVDYDYLEAAHAIRRAGLPLWLAQRLELGR